jgi:hypothetical protein
LILIDSTAYFVLINPSSETFRITMMSGAAAEKPPDDPDILLAAMSDDDAGVISDDCTLAESSRVAVALPPQEELWRQVKSQTIHEGDAGTDDGWRIAGRRGRGRGGGPFGRGGWSNPASRQQSSSAFAHEDGKFGNPNRFANTTREIPPVINSALGRVIILELTNVTEEEKKAFLGASIRMSNLVKNSPFGAAGVEEVSVNWKRKTLSILMKDKNSVAELILIKKLGPFDIACSQPLSHSLVRGVIGPIGMETTMEELQDELREQENQQGITAERLPKFSNGRKEMSLAVKLTFGSQTLPDSVLIGYLNFKVTPYVDRPLQCYKCQGFGHSSKWCNAREVCLVCSGEHMLKDCPRTRVKCVNCGANHAANYGGCPRMKQEAQVERVKVQCKITYSEAIKQVRLGETAQQHKVVDTSAGAGSASSQSAPGEQLNQGAVPNNRLWSSHTAPSAWTPPVKSSVDVACQTMPSACSATQTPVNVASVEVQSQSQSQTFIPDMRFCATLIEMASLMTHSQDHNFRCVLASNLIKKHYGASVDAEKLAAETSADGGLPQSKRKLSDTSSSSSSTSNLSMSSPRMNIRPNPNAQKKSQSQGSLSQKAQVAAIQAKKQKQISHNASFSK